MYACENLHLYRMSIHRVVQKLFRLLLLQKLGYKKRSMFKLINRTFQ